jgi:TM2 domain-containing membrane protein YozV
MFSSLGYGNPNPPRFIAPPPLNFANDWAIDPRLPRKNRTAFLVLGLLLGAFGAHSFYAGSTKKGLVQLAITVLTLGMAGVMVWIWAVIDICTITTDHDGIPFSN